MVPGQGLSKAELHISGLKHENEITTSMVDVERDKIQRAKTIENIRGREYRNEHSEGVCPIAGAG